MRSNSSSRYGKKPTSRTYCWRPKSQLNRRGDGVAPNANGESRPPPRKGTGKSAVLSIATDEPTVRMRTESADSLESKSTRSHSGSTVIVSRPKSPLVNFYIGVNAKDTICLEYGKARNWPVKMSHKIKWNGHSISAMSRDVAILDILTRESRGKTVLHVLDWFGSPRNFKFTKSLKKCEIIWTCAPDTKIAGDAARAVDDVRVNLPPAENLVEKFDVVIIQDVFQDGTRPTDRLSPSAIKKVCEYSRTGHCYVVARIFNGQAGADVYGNGKEEMVWFRQGEMVFASPEPEGQMYAAHPDINWLQYRNFDGVDSSELGHYGPYRVFRVKREYPNAQTLGIQTLPRGHVKKVFICTPGWLGWFEWIWNRYILKKGYNVHERTFAELAPRFCTKIPNGQILDSAKHSVQEKLSKDEEMRFLFNRFPESYMKIVNDTTLAVLYGIRTEQVRISLHMRESHVEVENDLTRLRGSSIKGGGRWLSVSMMIKTGFVVFGAVTLWKGGNTIVEEGVKKFRAWVSHMPRGLGTIVPNVTQSWVVRHPLAKFYGSIALVEEFVGYFLPKGKLLYAVLEFFYNARIEKTYVHRFRPLFMHVANYLVVTRFGVGGLLVAGGLHVANNLTAVRDYLYSRWIEFESVHAKGELIEAGSSQIPIPPGLTVRAYQSKLMHIDWPLRGSIRIFVDGIERQADEALSLLDEHSAENRIYPILVTHRLLWEPANTEKNLLVSILTRTHKGPFDERADEVERHRRWKTLGKFITEFGVFLGNVHVQYSIQESAKLMGKRGNRILKANEVDEIQGPMHLKKSISLKWNETITARKDFGNVVTMKPRPIVNLDPIYHARMAPLSRSLTDHLHEVFNGRILQMGEIKVKIFFAAGYTQSELTAIAQDFGCGTTTIAVSGDDSVVFWEEDGLYGPGEADQSQFDQSQDDGPVRIFAGYWMKQSGMPEWFIDMVYECCSRKYTVDKKRLRIKGKGDTQMPTGITVTTVLNSVSTIAMYLYFLYIYKIKKNRNYTLEMSGHDLGFTVKYFPAGDIGDITFLKGWWRKTIDGFHAWMPLPSACLKLGKLLRDPRDITRSVKTVHGIRVKTEDDYVTAVRKCSHALASSYGLVPDSYPIFGSFLSVLRRLGIQGDKYYGILEESWKPKIVELFEVDREDSIQAIIKRYGVSRDDIDRVEALLESISFLPCFVEDPIFDNLCEKDY
ncbi:hypothetical protein 1 [Kummerowia striata luteovirus]|nr:hypothetical protein 1 [Kummerowia striata luteovirus]